MCVDYHYLNNASTKDDFLLRNIHILLDYCAKNKLAYLVHYYMGYNQIIIDNKDVILWRTYCYRVMLFRLKTARTTYMRAMTTTFHDIMLKGFEFYVENVIIMSINQYVHVKNLRNFFESLCRYNIKLSLEKCMFGVPSRKLVVIIASQHGIEFNVKIYSSIDSSK